ncbi:MAG TPA: phosphoribosyltransferase family protein [Ilumatobacteraceae bacterium]|nr:phosphoribosyltransferase family protein [Ilumatobacteraceae bacterium]
MPFDLDAARARLTADFPLVNAHPDVAGVLRNPQLLALLGPALAAPYREAGITAICAPEARGPILGALVAVELGAGLVLVRKDDRNHPGADRRVESDPTWRGTPEVFQTRSWDLSPADRVLVVDDWVTTGSSTAAMRDLVLASGATYAGASVIVHKASDATIADLAMHWLVRFDDLISRES